MKTFYSKTLLLIMVITGGLFSVQVKADNNAPTLNFSSTPSLVSGSPLQIGAVYKFGSVTSGTDALVTIVSATGGASVAMIDDNSLTKPEAFSPQITVPANSTGLVTFRIDFVNGSGNLKNVTQFSATAMDIDGNSTLHEKDAIDMGAGSTVSYMASLLEINVQLTGTEYMGTNIAGNEYTGVDTSAKQVMFTVTSPAILNSFTYKAGASNQNNSSVTRQKGIYFKGFDYLTFLPVKYSSFTAVSSDKSVTLNWVTESEINSHHFEVERSFDGINFKTAGLVLDGFSVGNTGKSYTFKDNSTALLDVNVVYYRLKQVDNDGRYTYTNILAVRMQSLQSVSMQVSPNPCVENLTVRFSADKTGTALVQIISMNGQPVLSQRISISKGNNAIQVQDVKKLAPGTYIARLMVDGANIANQKIIKN